MAIDWIGPHRYNRPRRAPGPAAPGQHLVSVTGRTPRDVGPLTVWERHPPPDRRRLVGRLTGSRERRRGAGSSAVAEFYLQRYLCMTMRDMLELSDPAALRALAHPLRVRMLALLREQGPGTATTLARALGESS